MWGRGWGRGWWGSGGMKINHPVFHLWCGGVHSVYSGLMLPGTKTQNVLCAQVCHSSRKDGGFFYFYFFFLQYLAYFSMKSYVVVFIRSAFNKYPHHNVFLEKYEKIFTWYPFYLELSTDHPCTLVPLYVTKHLPVHFTPYLGHVECTWWTNGLVNVEWLNCYKSSNPIWC